MEMTPQGESVVFIKEGPPTLVRCEKRKCFKEPFRFAGKLEVLCGRAC